MPTQRRRKYTIVASKRGSRVSTLSGVVLPRVIGDGSLFGNLAYSQSHISRFADRMRRKPTRAEREFEKFLLSLNGGILREQFEMQHVVSGDWIVDFFFRKIRLGIEIDGGVHQTADQIKRDRQKEKDCARLDITLLRITNAEVFGNKDRLVRKLRQGWRLALGRENKVIGKVLTVGACGR